MTPLAVRRPVLGAHVPGPAAAWILARIDPSELDAWCARTNARGNEDRAQVVRLAYVELLEVATAYLSWFNASGNGNTEAPRAEADPDSETVALDTATAARTLGVSQRRVRQLLDDGSLLGQRVSGRWLVTRGSLEAHRIDRRLAG